MSKGIKKQHFAHVLHGALPSDWIKCTSQGQAVISMREQIKALPNPVQEASLAHQPLSSRAASYTDLEQMGFHNSTFTATNVVTVSPSFTTSRADSGALLATEPRISSWRNILNRGDFAPEERLVMSEDFLSLLSILG